MSLNIAITGAVVLNLCGTLVLAVRLNMGITGGFGPLQNSGISCAPECGYPVVLVPGGTLVQNDNKEKNISKAKKNFEPG